MASRTFDKIWNESEYGGRRSYRGGGTAKAAIEKTRARGVCHLEQARSIREKTEPTVSHGGWDKEHEDTEVIGSRGKGGREGSTAEKGLRPLR